MPDPHAGHVLGPDRSTWMSTPWSRGHGEPAGHPRRAAAGPAPAPSPPHQGERLQMQLSLNTCRHEDGATVTVAGEVDPGSGKALLEHALAVMGEQGPRLAVDLGEVTFMDSGGVEVLLAISDQANLRGGRLRLVCVPPRVQWLLQIIGVEAALMLDPARRPR